MLITYQFKQTANNKRRPPFEENKDDQNLPIYLFRLREQLAEKDLEIADLKEQIAEIELLINKPNK